MIRKTDPDPNEKPHYGGVWSAPAANLADIFRSCSTAEEAFPLALIKGYFSQYTAFPGRDFIERVTDWQLQLIASWLGPELSHLPPSLDELSCVPTHLLVDRHGRSLSPDLLRNLWYAQFLCAGEAPRLPLTAQNILEIGSGYGSLARCLKTLRPGATLWLVDLPESLASAAVYLGQAFPGRRIVHLDAPGETLLSQGEADFVLVPVGRAHELTGRHFDLGLNIWSFGEMPNGWIRKWFDLLQVECRVDRLYLLNGFMSPVTSDSPERCLQGDWLLNLDKSWRVTHFEVDPPIHRCPFVRKFYTGLALYATRLEDPEAIQAQCLMAAMEVEKVLLEDWPHLVMARERDDSGSPEWPFTLSGDPSLFRNWKTKPILAITEYIGLPRMESGLESPLFRLWNDFRCHSNPNSGVLLAAHLAMTGKALPGTRCAKEIVFLLGRIPEGCIHAEYLPLQNAFVDEIQGLGNQAVGLDPGGEPGGPVPPGSLGGSVGRRTEQEDPDALFERTLSQIRSGNYAAAVGTARALFEKYPAERTRNLYLESLSQLARSGTAWRG